MAIKIAINGYGRIGRNIVRAIYESGRNKEIQVTGKVDPDLLVRGDVSNRLRLASLSNNKWIYLHFDIVIGENGSPVMKFRVSADDPNAINVVTQ